MTYSNCGEVYCLDSENVLECNMLRITSTMRGGQGKGMTEGPNDEPRYAEMFAPHEKGRDSIDNLTAIDGFTERTEYWDTLSPLNFGKAKLAEANDASSSLGGPLSAPRLTNIERVDPNERIMSLSLAPKPSEEEVQMER